MLDGASVCEKMALPNPKKKKKERGS